MKSAIQRQMRAARDCERDEAHRATCGDRPFVGCAPRDPGLPSTLSAPAQTNPAPRAHDETATRP